MVSTAKENTTGYVMEVGGAVTDVEGYLRQTRKKKNRKKASLIR